MEISSKHPDARYITFNEKPDEWSAPVTKRNNFHPGIEETTEFIELTQDSVYVDEPSCIVNLSSAPSKASISIRKMNGPDETPDKDFTQLGILTPAVLSLYPAKERELKIEAPGFEPTIIILNKENGIEPRSGSNIEVHTSMYKKGMGPFDGTLRISSEPSGALIALTYRQADTDMEWIDYKPESAFITPETFNLPSKQSFRITSASPEQRYQRRDTEYKVALIKDGFESFVSDIIKIQPGAFIELRGKLRRISFRPEFQPIQ